MAEYQLNTTQSAVYTLVKIYVQRQQLVLDAMRDVRPDLLTETARKQQRLRSSLANSRGYWGMNKEWVYQIHGRGCDLTHTITQEPISWNDPDITNFDPNWFVNWLDWLISQPNNENLSIIKAYLEECNCDLRGFIFDILKQLRDMRMLHYYPERTDMYALASTDE